MLGMIAVTGIIAMAIYPVMAMGSRESRKEEEYLRKKHQEEKDADPEGEGRNGTRSRRNASRARKGC